MTNLEARIAELADADHPRRHDRLGRRRDAGPVSGRDEFGAVARRRARITGTEVALYAPGTQVDAVEGWMTLCEPHGCNAMHLTRKDAESWLSHPDQWCATCMGDDGVES